MSNKNLHKEVSLVLTAEELKKIQSILRWTKVAVQSAEKEKLIIEKILHKIRKLMP